jgi:dTDP-4-amino-4,6-dideoxygalactose transaminase
MEYGPESSRGSFQYPNVKAVIVVHLYGLSADLDPIIELCKKHNVTLIEDAAESLGTTYKGKYTGTFGDYGIFSLHEDKFYTGHYEAKTA